MLKHINKILNKCIRCLTIVMALPFGTLAQNVKPITNTQSPLLAYSGILVLLMIIGALQFFFPKYLKTCFASLVENKVSSFAASQDIISKILPGGLYDFIFANLLAVLSLIYYKVYYANTSFIIDAMLILKTTLIVFIGLLFKIFFRQFIIWMFNWSIFKDYASVVTRSKRHLLVVWLLPVIILCSFSSISSVFTKPLINITIIIFFILNLIIIYKLVLLIRERGKVTLNEFFLYFCIGELLPLGLIIKFSYNLLLR